MFISGEIIFMKQYCVLAYESHVSRIFIKY
jgi:hypothetical protein